MPVWGILRSPARHGAESVSPELRERLIFLLTDLRNHVGQGIAKGFYCACCGERDHEPDCELQACLQELRALPQTEHPSINDGVLAIYGFKPVP